jgi:transcriptional regulator with XRE-family HTH domain
MPRALAPSAARHNEAAETPQFLLVQYWARLGRKVRTDELAAICGVARTTLVNVINGRYPPSEGLFCRLANELGVSRARLDAALQTAQLNRSKACPPFAT